MMPPAVRAALTESLRIHDGVAALDGIEPNVTSYNVHAATEIRDYLDRTAADAAQLREQIVALRKPVGGDCLIEAVARAHNDAIDAVLVIFDRATATEGAPR